MTRFTNPLLHPSDLTLPSVGRSDLWAAPTAAHWYSIYLATTNHATPIASLPDRVRRASARKLDQRYHAGCSVGTTRSTFYGMWSKLFLGETHLLKEHANETPPGCRLACCSIHVVYRASCYASFFIEAKLTLKFIGMVWDCQLLRCWLKHEDDHCEDLPVLNDARAAMISQTLEGLQMDAHNCDPPVSAGASAELQLIGNYFQLALHAPLKNLPVFAGSEGETEAHGMLFSLQVWAQSKDARKSLWYAAQIFRHARTLPRSSVHTITAVAVYHASLTLWTFAIIAGGRSKGTSVLAASWTTSDAQDRRLFALDGDLTPQVRHFLALGDDRAAISRNGNPAEKRDLVPIQISAGTLMHTGIEILSPASYDLTNLPKFVDGLVSLMDDLAKAANSVGLG